MPSLPHQATHSRINERGRRQTPALRGQKVWLPVAWALALGVGAPPIARAQSSATQWSGSITAKLDSDTTATGVNYSRHDTQTWTLTGAAPKKNGAITLYPATWHYTGSGTRTESVQDPQEGAVQRTYQWSVDTTAKVVLAFRTADKTRIIGQWSTLAVAPNAIRVTKSATIESGVPTPARQFTATAEQWAFGRIEDDEANTTVTGSSTLSVGQLPAPLGLTDGSHFQVNCTWNFTQGSTGGTSGQQTPSPAAPQPGVDVPGAAPQVATPQAPGGDTRNTTPPTSEKQVVPTKQPGTSSLLPAVAGVTPSSGQQWADQLVVTFDAKNTHFVQGTTKVDLGAGVTPVAIAPIAAVDVAAPTKVLATLKIAGDAVPGPRSITIITGSEVVKLANGFTVAARDVKEVFPASPDSGQQGQQDLAVMISRPTGYWSSYFYAGTKLNFGPGVTVTSVEVQSGSSVRAFLNIDANATLGPRTVTVSRPTFADEAFPGAFTVTAAHALPGGTTQLSPGSITHQPGGPASPPGGGSWTGTIQAKIQVTGTDYQNTQTQVWTLTGGAPTSGAYPATWSVTGGGGTNSSTQWITQSGNWTTNVAATSAPLYIALRSSDNNVVVTSAHSPLTANAAATGNLESNNAKVSGENAVTDRAISNNVLECPLPTIEGAPGSTRLSGTSTSTGNVKIDSGQPPNAQVTITYTWQLNGTSLPSSVPTGPSNQGTQSTGRSNASRRSSLGGASSGSTGGSSVGGATSGAGGGSASEGWSGFVQAKIQVTGTGYQNTQTQVWTLAGGAPSLGAYPANWSVTGGGGINSSTQWITQSGNWTTSVAATSAPLNITVRSSDNKVVVTSAHSPLTANGAASGSLESNSTKDSGGGATTDRAINYNVFECPLPTIEGASGSTSLSGTSTSTSNVKIDSGQPPNAQVTITYTWQLKWTPPAGGGAP